MWMELKKIALEKVENCLSIEIFFDVWTTRKKFLPDLKLCFAES